MPMSLSEYKNFLPNFNLRRLSSVWPKRCERGSALPWLRGEIGRHDFDM